VTAARAVGGVAGRGDAGRALADLSAQAGLAGSPIAAALEVGVAGAAEPRAVDAAGAVLGNPAETLRGARLAARTCLAALPVVPAGRIVHAEQAGSGPVAAPRAVTRAATAIAEAAGAGPAMARLPGKTERAAASVLSAGRGGRARNTGPAGVAAPVAAGAPAGKLAPAARRSRAQDHPQDETRDEPTKLLHENSSHPRAVGGERAARSGRYIAETRPLNQIPVMPSVRR
jgi:hypothetical protein